MARVVWVDQEECISCGLCVSMLPEVFDFDDGKSKAIHPYAASANKIQECIDSCPVTAIKWRDE